MDNIENNVVLGRLQAMNASKVVQSACDLWEHSSYLSPILNDHLASRDDIPDECIWKLLHHRNENVCLNAIQVATKKNLYDLLYLTYEKNTQRANIRHAAMLGLKEIRDRIEGIQEESPKPEPEPEPVIMPLPNYWRPPTGAIKHVKYQFNKVY